MRSDATTLPQAGEQTTMSSLEIAERTGKLHKNVLADIRGMLAELGKAEAEFSAVARVPGPNGSMRDDPCFNLPKRVCLIVVSGYPPSAERGSSGLSYALTEPFPLPRVLSSFQLGELKGMRQDVLPNAPLSAPRSSSVENIARAYLVTAHGDAEVALHAAIADALADLCEAERRTRRQDRLISRGYVRAALHEAVR